MTLTFDNKLVYVGDWPKFTATFVDVNGAAADPATVTFRIRRRASVIRRAFVYGTDSEVTKDATGVYTARLQINGEGLHFIRVESDDVFGAAYEDEFTVQPARF